MVMAVGYFFTNFVIWLIFLHDEIDKIMDKAFEVNVLTYMAIVSFGLALMFNCVTGTVFVD
jgi:hypothetical protein